MADPVTSPKPALREVALLFLKLGTTAFGGPAAHVALMEEEVVRRRQWLTRDEFLDLLGAAHLIPGPNSTELAIHIGHRRAGWPGLLVAGVCFILPAFTLVTLAAWAYVEFGKLPAAEGLLRGVKPVIIAVVAQALWGLGRSALKTRALVLVGLAAAGLVAAGLHELLVLFGAGTVMIVHHRTLSGPGPRSGGDPGPRRLLLPIVGLGTTLPLAAVSAGTGAATGFSLGALFLFFLKVGSVLFGSGYVLLAFLRSDLVERWGWLTEAQLLDAVAIGQFTPGPLFTTATFVGYLLGGFWAGVVATVGIFLPAFVFVALSGPFVPRLRSSPTAGAFLDGVNVASLALMAVVTWHLGRDALADLPSVLLALASAVLLLQFRINSAWLVAGGALIGVVLHTG